MTRTPAPRKWLSADALFRNIHQTFHHIPDPRTGNPWMQAFTPRIEVKGQVGERDGNGRRR
jgi:hypothetical protein